jgi:predicted lysophospholipase L1 biosynthesis ABC-type transport system permease subunit
VEDLDRDLRYGVRDLTRNPGFSVLAVLTLSLGIGATTAIFSVVYAVVIRPLPFAEQEQLVVAWKKDTTADSPFVELALPEFKDWQAQSRSFSSLAAMPTTAYGYGYVLTGQARPRFNSVLLNWLSAFALLLAVVGVHGVVAYAVTERTSEFGLRMALGASARDILKLVIDEGMRPVLIGVGIGLTSAFFLSRWVAGLLFELSATDTPTFLGVPTALAGVALLACRIPAVRATKMDPAMVLRGD